MMATLLWPLLPMVVVTNLFGFLPGAVTLLGGGHQGNLESNPRLESQSVGSRPCLTLSKLP
jgi:hypothetical protein